MLHRDFSHELYRAYTRLCDRDRYRTLRRVRNRPADALVTFCSFARTESIFVHIPKTGGMSVARALYGDKLGHGSHHSIADYQVAFSAREFRRYFKFTFVRNPWDRAYSAYSFLRRGGMDEEDRAWSEATLPAYPDFESFVLNWLTPGNAASWIHFRPQVGFLRRRPDNALGIDYVGRFEALAGDFAKVADRLGIDAKLQHSNRSERVASWRDVYTPAMRDAIARTYAADIRAFGYSFE